MPPRTARAIAVALLLAGTAAAPLRAGADELRNWGNDPFMQLSQDVADCPEPLGPRMTEAEWKADAHWRIETGTSCWLAGKCADSNAYRYDAPLAAALFPTLQAAHDTLAGSSVWVFVQRRVVFLQGCVRDAAQGDALEAIARQGKDVTMAVPAFRIGAGGRVPYRVLPH